jgi:hypothetical protein
MLALFIILAGAVIALLFAILFIKIDDVDETAHFAWNKFINLDQKLFGNSTADLMKMDLDKFFGFKPGMGLFGKLKEVTDCNNSVLVNKINALADYLKIEYIDEKKIVNGKEEQVFKGYRKKNQK